MCEQQETRCKYVYLCQDGKKKISFRHHERRAPDFLKKMAAKKIIMAGNERAPKKIKSKKGESKSEKTNFSFLLSLRTYSLDAKQEA